MAQPVTADIKSLSVPERIILVEEIWDSIAAEQESLPITAARCREELDRRLAESDAAPEEGRDVGRSQSPASGFAMSRSLIVRPAAEADGPTPSNGMSWQRAKWFRDDFLLCVDEALTRIRREPRASVCPQGGASSRYPAISLRHLLQGDEGKRHYHRRLPRSRPAELGALRG